MLSKLALLSAVVAVAKSQVFLPVGETECILEGGDSKYTVFSVGNQNGANLFDAAVVQCAVELETGTVGRVSSDEELAIAVAFISGNERMLIGIRDPDGSTLDGTETDRFFYTDEFPDRSFFDVGRSNAPWRINQPNDLGGDQDCVLLRALDQLLEDEACDDEIETILCRIPCLDAPTISPTTPAPTNAPSISPSESPSVSPTLAPSGSPSESPSLAPSESPTISPSAAPTLSPSVSPSQAPSTSPSLSPTQEPTGSPAVVPTFSPTLTPSDSPSTSPSLSPTLAPSDSPTTSPTVGPTTSPTTPRPTTSPTFSPTKGPTTEAEGDNGSNVFSEIFIPLVVLLVVICLMLLLLIIMRRRQIDYDTGTTEPSGEDKNLEV